MAAIQRTIYEYPPVTDELLHEIVQRILKAGSPIKIVLFGSRACGNARADSDIDIMVIEKKGMDRTQLERKYSDAVYGLFPEFTLLVYPENEVEEWRYVPAFITTQALREGIVLYERDAGPAKTIRIPSVKEEGQEKGEHKEPIDLSKLWFRKAEEDIANCEVLLEKDMDYSLICFHAQQAIEKYLKGFLALHGREFPKTHDLSSLSRDCADIVEFPDFSHLPMQQLSDYSKKRYDLHFWPPKTEAQNAAQAAMEVRKIIYAAVPPAALP